MRAVVRTRELLASSKPLAQQLKKLECKVSTHDEAIVGIHKTIRELTHAPVIKTRQIGFTANLDETR